MRVTTAFNKMLGIPGATVAEVSFTPVGIVVRLRRRFRRLTCPCGFQTRAIYDTSVRRWRHLDLGACRLLLECDVRRLDCARCDRVRTEQVPWARPAARHTKDLEDVVTFLAQRVDKTTIARLLRISWEAVANIVMRVVADKIDDSRLDDLYRIGVDEVSYRKGHRYLTVVADHDRGGAVVWAAEGNNAKTLRTFYDELGEVRKAKLQAVSLDMGIAYAQATTDEVPHVTQCVDPFHVIQLANLAIDKARRWAWNLERRTNPELKRPQGRPPKGSSPPPNKPRWVKHTRWALLKDPGDLNDAQVLVLDSLRRGRSVLYRCWQLKEALRDLYRLRRSQDAALHLDWWLAWACRSRIPSFVMLSKTIRTNRDRILAAVQLGLSNSKLEGLNSKIRLINHRGYGHHSATALISMIYLCCGGITVQLPTER
ncbi:MAG TPA: ISL3 family transposase [Actinomycetota bacterium]|nr:ISL3 family transposase [Actinomycetota bacterium]